MGVDELDVEEPLFGRPETPFPALLLWLALPDGGTAMWSPFLDFATIAFVLGEGLRGFDMDGVLNLLPPARGPFRKCEEVCQVDSHPSAHAGTPVKYHVMMK